VIARALAPARGDRFASVGELIDAARAALPRPKRSRAYTIGLIALIGAGVAAIGAMQLRGRRAHGIGGATTLLPDAAPAGRGDPSSARAVTSLGGCAEGPAFADAHTLAFDLAKDGQVQLYALDLDAPRAAPRALTHGSVWSWRAAPGRRAGEVVYLETDTHDTSKDAIAFVDATTGAPAPGRFVTWSAGVGFLADAVVYSTANGARIDAHTAARDEQLVQIPPEWAAQQIATGPGGGLAFVSARPGEPYRDCVWTPGPSHAIDCLPTTVLRARPAFSADGRALYVATAGGIVRHPLSGAPDEAISPARAESGLAVAPGGDALAWSECAGETRIVAIDGKGGEQELARGRSLAMPAPGPDGQLAYVDRDDRGARLLVRRADGTTVEVVPPGGEIAFPSFTPDGGAIVMKLGGAHGGVFRVDVGADQPVTRLTDDIGDMQPLALGANHVMFTRFDEHEVGYVLEVNGYEAPHGVTSSTRITMAYDAGAGLALLAAPDALRWWDPRKKKEKPGPTPPGTDLFAIRISPKGTWMLWQLGELGQELYRQRLHPPGPIEHLIDLPADEKTELAGIDDDGRAIVARSTWRGELHVMRARPGERF
jgi:hypothetical protein